jgi:hypothetical protein
MQLTRILIITPVILILGILSGAAQPSTPQAFLPKDDLIFLENMTKEVLEASRIYPGQVIPGELGANNTGGVLIRPGGRNAYPSFWIRDYAMSLETGLVSKAEQKHMLLLTAATQCDQTRISKGGSLIPYGAIADHIRIDDGKPIYFPGTYSEELQGTPEWGTLPPYCDQFYFVHMAYYYVKTTGDKNILLSEINGTRLIDRLKAAFHLPPSDNTTHIVYTSELFRGVDFGFRDAQTITGHLSFTSVLKYRAALEMAEMLQQIKSAESKKYLDIAASIKQHLPAMFIDQRGMLRASTGKSNQPDVWATALAAYFGVLKAENLQKASETLVEAYKAGTLSYKGSIRHILTTDDFSEHSAWEISLSEKNTYQNGAYWSTPTGWVCYAMQITDPLQASALAREFIEDLRANDFRKGETFGAPYECFNKSGYTQNPVYLTSVACPLEVFRKLNK